MAKTIKLSDAQLILLPSGGQREDRGLLPPPETWPCAGTGPACPSAG